MLGMIRCYVAVVIECRNTALSEVVRTILLRWNVPEMVVQPLRVKPLHVEDASLLGGIKVVAGLWQNGNPLVVASFL
jgi:hypothetical protein